MSNGLLGMYLSRFLTGVFQAFPVVYLPVWVDDFAPSEVVSRWMSFTQIASICGTVSGYFLSGVLSHIADGHLFLGAISRHRLTWRLPFLLQAALLVPTTILLACLPAEAININLSVVDRKLQRRGSAASLLSSPEEAARADGCFRFLRYAWTEVLCLLKTPLYVLITLGMSNLYFVLTGIQFWITEYMVAVLHHDKLLVVSVSTFTFLTAPTAGVAFGGFVCDAIGGYRGHSRRKIIRVATAFAGMAAICACAASQSSAAVTFIFLLWGCLFCGAALVPFAVGMVLSCVPSHRRSLSSAVSQLSYNIFGWCAAPLISGVVMELVALREDIAPETPLRIGFCMMLITSVFGFLLFAVANLVTIDGDAVDDDTGTELLHESVRD
eukprot:GHVS01039933.1.p1 GENE.GHVS01039933.1~~GHVS01039933.1.p1  ORF type:complete len:448 (-),score=50.80 GHVS01039933.1:203-1351(-)